MKKILVIEDEPAIRNNIVDLLEAEEFQTWGAENGEVGVRLAQEYVPDLILCDVSMPKLDGYGVLKALRQNPRTAAIPVIFLTAMTDRASLRQGMELGAEDYLTKPCTPNEILTAIATQLNKRANILQQFDAALQQTSQQINDLLYYDSLTNLPNQLLLQQQLNQAIKAWGLAHPPPVNPETTPPPFQLFAQVDSSRLVPVLYLGLDRFKRINANLGHDNGDLLIKAVAERLQACIVSYAIGRCKADQFALILPPVQQKKAAADVAKTILESLSQAFTLKTQEVFITASIGIAFYPKDGWEMDQLLHNANRAMEQVKQQGGNQYGFYKVAVSINTSDRLALETDLRYALEREELQLHYQPQVNLQSGKIVGAEALLRWYHPQRGLVSPAKFIPLAEELGLIESIGDWVLSAACQQIQTWHTAGFGLLRIAVNLSARQFNQPHLRHRLVKILADTSLDPQYLELELTESILVQNPEIAIKRLNALKALNIQIAIDDFGTGYSSLSYLQQFPFDILKIDQCFVRNLTTDAKTAAIITAIIQMAHSLNLKVVAEGVETEAELTFLRQHQCDDIQGYLFSRPLSVPDFEKLLERSDTHIYAFNP